ncbi:MAG: CHAT domain-containing protein [Cyanobacteria bacterium P01_F01_bin.150]
MARRFQKRWIFAGLVLVGVLLCVLAQPLKALERHVPRDLQENNIPILRRMGKPNGGQSETGVGWPLLTSFAHPTLATLALDSLAQPLAQSQQLYEAGRLAEAIASLQQALDIAVQTGDIPTQLTALRNLALMQQELRQFDDAQQAIDQAFDLLDANPTLINKPIIRASLLDVQGSIAFGQGLSDAALSHWQTAADQYEQAEATEKALQTRINQAQALQKLGFYRQAIVLLTPIVSQLNDQEDTARHAIALHSLGEALRFVGDLDQSRAILEASLDMSKLLQHPDLTETVLLSWANTVYAQGDQDTALRTYRSLTATTTGELQIQALSNQISLLLDMEQTNQAKALWPSLTQLFNTLPPSQTVIFAMVNGAKRFIDVDSRSQPPRQDLAKALAIALQQAQTLGDGRSESYAVGILGRLYERSNRLQEAQQLSEQALTVAQRANATDISYLWQWQLGRIYKAQGDRLGQNKVWGLKQVQDSDPHQSDLQQASYDRAIASYSSAIDTLKTLRTDLVAVNAQVQVSFQDSVEPIHRELVSLLLDDQRRSPDNADIEQARTVIEALQLAELDNFFREACLDSQPVEIDDLDPTAAVIYPIMLSDRMETVVSFPNHELRHYSSPIPRQEVERLVAELRPNLTLRIGNRFRPGVSKLYDWIMRSLETDLKDNNIKTLVFVLDGALRNIPMAALYDGESYLIESYTIAITPGLELVDPQPLQEQRLGVLTGALSESRQGFAPLPNVVPEVEQIQATVPAQVLFNEEFTQESFQAALAQNAEPIVHLASHGSFSSNKEQTFILTWDGQLNISTLNASLKGAELSQQRPIELLVLSACQTAAGDKEAALGLAGMAVRAGARSTIATLWTVNDETTALLMKQFYVELSNREQSKAEALRQAQLKLLQDPFFRGRPYYWAPYILVGNWL